MRLSNRHTILRALRRWASDDRGFSMIPAITAVMFGTFISLGAWTAAHSDISLQNTDRWSKRAYTLAESGASDYTQSLQENNDYWQLCDSPPGLTGNGIGQTALNDGRGTDPSNPSDPPRRWLPQPTAGSTQDQALTGQYTIDLIPANGQPKCSTGPDRSVTMIDSATGVLRIRVTGRAGPPAPSTNAAEIASWRQTKWKKRSVILEFRRKGFLDYAWFTDKEGMDPVYQGGASNCANYYSPPSQAALSQGRFYWNGWYVPFIIDRRPECVELPFGDGDDVNGPFHTNDAVLLKSSIFDPDPAPRFGNPGRDDPIEISDSRCPFRSAYSGIAGVHSVPNGFSDPGLLLITTIFGQCSTWDWFGVTPRPNIQGDLRIGAAKLPMPESNKDLAQYAPNSTYYGRTKITLKTNGKMDVVNNGTTYTNLDYPASGVVWVGNTSGVSNCVVDPNALYPGLATGCALAEVQGTYDRPITIGSEADIAIVGDTRRQSGAAVAVLGLNANNFVRVRRPGTCANPASDPFSTTVQYIDAGILAVNHSFMIDHPACGGNLGTLHLNGAIAQTYAGFFNGQRFFSGGSGFDKDFQYDYRYKYLTPPHFLTEAAAGWRLSRQREQVPACAICN